MKTSLIITALMIALAVATGFNNRRVQQQLVNNGAASGTAIAEMHETFAQRELRRVRDVQAAQDSRERAANDQRAAEAEHKKIWDEIERQQKFDKQ
jgi:hypothetical protein